MQSRMWGNEYRTTMVCVDSYEAGECKGRLYNPSLPEGQKFQSLMDFLLKMERLLDGMNFPQSFSAVRSFSGQVSPTVEPPPGAESRRGRRATFGLRVLFRQNASWQGSVAWLEGGQEESFRSVLELLMLMHSAMEGETKNSGKRPAASVSCDA